MQSLFDFSSALLLLVLQTGRVFGPVRAVMVLYLQCYIY